MTAIISFYLDKLCKNISTITESYTSSVGTAIFEAFQLISESNKSLIFKHLIQWITCLQFYPRVESNEDLINHLLDAGQRIFGARYSPFFHSRALDVNFVRSLEFQTEFQGRQSVAINNCVAFTRQR